MQQTNTILLLAHLAVAQLTIQVSGHYTLACLKGPLVVVILSQHYQR
jgi:hypothetical protein